MVIQVKFIGVPDAAKAAGQKALRQQIEGSTLGDLLRSLERTYGPPLSKALLTEGGAVRDTIQILHNGRDYVARDAFGLPLQEGDDITFLMMMAGG